MIGKRAPTASRTVLAKYTRSSITLGSCLPQMTQIDRDQLWTRRAIQRLEVGRDVRVSQGLSHEGRRHRSVQRGVPRLGGVGMAALTLEERSRVFIARENARRTALARPAEPQTAGRRPGPGPGPRVGAVLAVGAIAVLLGVSCLALEVVEFHVPVSIAEALLPRL